MRPAALLCLLVASCATRPAISWNAGDHRFCSPHDCYDLADLGPAWRLVEHQEGEVGFFNAGVGAVIQSNATCRDDIEAAPLQSLTDHLLVGYTARHVRTSETVQLARREALRTVIDVKLDGVPFVLDLYVFRRNGCVIDLSYAAPPDKFEVGAADFQRFIGGFSEAPMPARS